MIHYQDALKNFSYINDFGTFLTSKANHTPPLPIRCLLTCLKQGSHSGTPPNEGGNILKQVTVHHVGRGTTATI